MPKFLLFEHQVPAPPLDSKEWVDVLRWMLCVMDGLDERLGFVAGVLSYLLKNDGITPKQAEACNGIYRKILADYHSQILVCQNNTQRDARFDEGQVH